MYRKGKWLMLNSWWCYGCSYNTNIQRSNIDNIIINIVYRKGKWLMLNSWWCYGCSYNTNIQRSRNIQPVYLNISDDVNKNMEFRGLCTFCKTKQCPQIKTKIMLSCKTYIFTSTSSYFRDIVFTNFSKTTTPK